MADPDSSAPVTAAEATATGIGARTAFPRSSLAAYEHSDRNATVLIEAQNVGRIPELVPIRMQRMSADPVSFFRGSVAVMASDLGRGGSSGIEVIASGDAHLGNFGYFVSPLRRPVFDLNDFDQACLAPWEWDLKRLMTSAIVAGRHAGLAEKTVRAASEAAASSYRRALAESLELGVADRYYARVDTDVLGGHAGSTGQRILAKTIRQAQRHAASGFVATSTRQGPNGRRTFVDDPPTLSHAGGDELDAQHEIFAEYRRTVDPEVAILLSQYRLEDAARRVVGVGSVGTRCFVLLLTDPLGQPLVLQVKEAAASVLQSHGGLGVPTGREGRRVVTYQRVLQAVSDVFLGHVRFEGRDFYLRQFRDAKTVVDIGALSPAQFVTYLSGCGVVLARAHAQSPRAAEVSGYLGSSSKADHALLGWAIAYAEQSASDYQAFRESLS